MPTSVYGSPLWPVQVSTPLSGDGSATAPLDVALDEATVVVNASNQVEARGLKTGLSNGNTALLQAYDVDNATYRTFATLTAGNTPALALLPPSGGTLAVAATTYAVGAAAGVDASIVIPAVATITVTKGLITAVV